MPRSDLAGKRFGRLLVLELLPSDGSGFSKWLCLCDCGTKKSIYGYWMTRSYRYVRSCGCLLSESTGRRAYKHGATKDPARKGLHRIWIGMKQRCCNPRARVYRWYGARGITIAPAWRHDFAVFEKYVMENLGPRPTPKHSIDRIDNDGNYEPGNIRWATPLEQSKNKREARKPAPGEVCGLDSRYGPCRNRIKIGGGPCWRHR